jgi:hypothetical protein
MQLLLKLSAQFLYFIPLLSSLCLLRGDFDTRTNIFEKHHGILVKKHLIISVKEFHIVAKFSRIKLSHSYISYFKNQYCSLNFPRVQVKQHKSGTTLYTGLFLLATGHDCEIGASTTAKGAIGKENCGVACNLMAKQALAPAMARAIDWCRDHNNGGTEIDGAAGINVYELASCGVGDQPRRQSAFIVWAGKTCNYKCIVSLSAGVINISLRADSRRRNKRELRNRANLIRTGVFTSALRHTH